MEQHNLSTGGSFPLTAFDIISPSDLQPLLPVGCFKYYNGERCIYIICLMTLWFQLQKRGIAHQGIAVDSGEGGLSLTLLG